MRKDTSLNQENMPTHSEKLSENKKPAKSHPPSARYARAVTRDEKDGLKDS